MNNKNSEKIFERTELDNGLELKISFKSIYTAGDRYQVVFKAAIDVEIKDSYFNDEVLIDLNPGNARKLLGDKTSFNYSKTRNFIAEDEKDSLLKDMKDQFVESSIAYLSSQAFPMKLIKRNYIKAEQEEMIRLKKEKYFSSTFNPG